MDCSALQRMFGEINDNCVAAAATSNEEEPKDIAILADAHFHSILHQFRAANRHTYDRCINFYLVVATESLLALCKSRRFRIRTTLIANVTQVVDLCKYLRRIEANYILMNIVENLNILDSHSASLSCNQLEQYKLEITNLIKFIYSKFTPSSQSDSWNCILPYSGSLNISMLLGSESSPRIKSQLLALIERGIRSLKRLIISAQKHNPKGKFCIFTISNQIAVSLVNLHSILLKQLLSVKNTVLTNGHLLKCLALLIETTPYVKIDPALTIHIYEALFVKLEECSNVNVQVAIIKCFSNLLIKSPQIDLLKAKFLSRQSEADDGSSEIESIMLLATKLQPCPGPLTESQCISLDGHKEPTKKLPKVLEVEMKNLVDKFNDIYGENLNLATNTRLDVIDQDFIKNRNNKESSSMNYNDCLASLSRLSTNSAKIREDAQLD